MLSVERGPTFPSWQDPSNGRRFLVPQPGQSLLITDTPASSAQFLVHALLQLQLKREDSNRTCVVVSLDNDLAHMAAIAARSNLNLQQCMADKSLVYIDALSQASQPPNNLTDAHAPGILVCPPLQESLRPLYDLVQRAFETVAPTALERLLILGDISTLEWIGISPIHINRFIRAVRALAVQHTFGVVIVYHSPGTQLPIESSVLRTLVTSCDVHLEVRELSSGLSSAVSGEVAMHTGFTAPDPHLVPIPRQRALQYRLTDSGVVWIDRGTSASVL